MKLEEKQQQSDAKCFPLSYFYGRDAQPEPLIRNQTLVDFYHQLNKEVLHG
ncbi:MAG: hypothetical protein ACXW0Q_07140 [Methylovulum sp.]